MEEHLGERWYQREGREELDVKWEPFLNKKPGPRILMYIAPTGAGKTYLFTNIGRRNKGNTLYAAHRNELVSQMSLALNMWRVPHTIIAPKKVVKWINALHMEEHGYSCYLPSSNHYVSSIQTLYAQLHKWEPLLRTMTLFVLDEGHHVLRDNIYGKVAAKMPFARGLLTTATCLRADGKGLGAHAEGIVDDVVVGPTMRTVIDDGFLTDFLVKSVPSDIDTSNIPITPKGDYSGPKLAFAASKSHIVGDIVDHYMEYARGKLGATFVTDQQTGIATAARFNKAGIRAEFVSHLTPGPKRHAMMQAYKRRELLQLVNIDLFGEGFDAPAMQVCSYGRPSKSRPVVVQQFGRPLRPMWPKDLSAFDMNTALGRKAAIASGEKPYALLLDHAGNFTESNHGLPDKTNLFTLDSRERRSTQPADVIPVRVCGNTECMGVFEKVEPKCPYCGWIPTTVARGRSGPEEVEGKLCDLDPDARDRLEMAAKLAVQDPEAYRRELVAKRCPPLGVERNVRRHEQRAAYQEALRSILNIWNGQCRVQGWDETTSQQRFYFKFGVDMLSAQSLPLKETEELVSRVIMEGI